MNDVTLFDFERDFVGALHCIPMAVRFKLDLCGIKLSLRQWNRLGPEDRRGLLMQTCDGPAAVDAYRDRLVHLIRTRAGGEVKGLPDGSAPPSADVDRTPDELLAYATALGVDPPDDRVWRGLTPLQRFTLLKLCRDAHDNLNFVPALKEFGLYAGAPPVAAAAS